MLKEICTLVFLGGNAWKDMRSREISLSLAGVYAVGGILCGILEKRAFADGMLPVAIGLVFLTLAFVSGGGIGIGDGWILLAMGCFMDTETYVRTLMIALLLAALLSGIILVGLKRNGKTQIPFVPFLLLGYIGGLLI